MSLMRLPADYHADGPEYFDPIQVEHCWSCRKKLPEWDFRKPHKKPVMHKVHYDELEVDEHGFPVGGGPRLATEEEIARGDYEKEVEGPYWKCPHCGHGHDWRQAWD